MACSNARFGVEKHGTGHATTVTGQICRSPGFGTSFSAVTGKGSEGSSALSLAYPNVPLNSPENRSSFGEAVDSTIDPVSIAERLEAMPTPVPLATPRGSAVDELEVRTPIAAPSKLGPVDPLVLDKTSTYEHSIWEDIAEEDVARALARMTMLAKDEHEKKDGEGKTVTDYYSSRLAKLLKAAELEFDVKYLK